MAQSGWFIHEIDSSNHITPYQFNDGQNQPLKLYSFPNYPDGLLRTSVRELSLYLIAFMNGGKNSRRRLRWMMARDSAGIKSNSRVCGDIPEVIRKLYTVADNL